MPRKLTAERRKRVFLNAGSGGPSPRVPKFFRGWKQIRIDIDPAVAPDLVASITDISAIPDAAADAIWAAHCVEHLFAYEVPLALREFHRVLRKTGFICIVVPDIQTVAHWIAEDRLRETIYKSAAGPVTAHDVMWGFEAAISRGSVAMAHHCGFTPTVLLDYLSGAGFEEILLRRKSNLELVALALPRSSGNSKRREVLLAKLGF